MPSASKKSDMKNLQFVLISCAIALELLFADSGYADVPKKVDGLTYHDLFAGDGPIVKPGDTIHISISDYEFDPSRPDGRGALIVQWPPHIVVAGHAALGDWDHYSFELGIVGMRIGGNRLIFSPGLYADADSRKQRIKRPHVIDVRAVKIDNSYYHNRGR
jgi:hypothetical protein